MTTQLAAQSTYEPPVWTEWHGETGIPGVFPSGNGPHAGVLRPVFEQFLLSMRFFGCLDERRGEPPYIRRVEIPSLGGAREIVEFRSASGLPSSADRDKFMAFCRIAMEQRARDGQLTNPVSFTAGRLLNELGLKSDGGTHYAEIYDWTQRMVDTTITSKKVVFFAASRSYSNSSEHVFESSKRVGSQIDKRTAERYEVVLAPWVLNNLNAGYAIAEDFATYKSLKRPTAKAIFGPLHFWFAGSGGLQIQREYTELCTFLGIQSYEYQSKIRSTLGEALKELVQVKYLAAWDLQLRASLPGYKVVLWPGEAILDSLKRSSLSFTHGDQAGAAVPALPAPNAAGDTETHGFALTSLEALGMNPVIAEKLLQTYDPSRVLDVVEWVSFRKENADPKNKPTNPAGLVVYMLRKGEPVPAGFVTTREKQAIEATRLLAAESGQQKMLLQIEFDTWKNQQVEKEIATRYPGAALDAKIAEIVAELRRNDKQFASLAPDQRNFIARQKLFAEIRELQPFPPIEAWAKKGNQWARLSQQSLFANSA